MTESNSRKQKNNSSYVLKANHSVIFDRKKLQDLNISRYLSRLTESNFTKIND